MARNKGWTNTITLLSGRGWLTALWAVIGIWSELHGSFLFEMVQMAQSIMLSLYN